jgi:ABC-type multidrug transport system fused ATPase/permease subunit
MKNIIKFRFAGIGIMLAAIAVFSTAVMLLWNALLPSLFTFPQIGYLQAAGLLILARILFGGIGGGLRGHAAHFGARGDGLFNHGNKLREKWMNMSEDERKEFIEKEKDFFKFNRRFSHFRDFFDDEDEHREDERNE